MRIKQLFAVVFVLAFAGQTAAINASAQNTLRNFGFHLKRWNRGMATALMSTLDNEFGTTCVTSADATSDEVFALMDFENYLNDGFNLGIFMNGVNVVFVKLMQQYEDCGVNELYIKYDNIMSHLSDIISLCVNLIVMIATGWKNKDTAPYKSWDLMSDGWKYKDWAGIGTGFQLLFAQLAKYDAPEINIEVNIMEFT